LSKRYFGTDGIRGIANEKLTPELVFQLGQAAGRWVRSQNQIPRAVIGRDTRRSGPMLGAALAAGLTSAGIEVVALGIAPTPAVSYAARTGQYSLGAVLSASHNPAPDNGIKFVGHDGRKLPDADEILIEQEMERTDWSRPTGADIGVLRSDRSDLDHYLGYLVSLLPERLEGFHVAVDAANGAAHELAPQLLERLGAKVSSMGTLPDGNNINDGVGATRPQSIQTFTQQSGADLGVAFDGDADRAIFSDERGQLINGDRTLGIWAVHHQARGELDPPMVVGTVMTNGGFEHFLSKNGIRTERAPVGDKYVAERIQATGAKIGGEQSGHLIFPHRSPTGDGMISMLELLRVLRAENRPASSFVDAYEPWPQLLVNLATPHTDGWNEGPLVSAAIAAAEESLRDLGRVVVRPSGTQPMIRVMVEAADASLRDQVAEQIVEAMKQELSATEYSRVDLTHALGD
jgi:phosphoglucosamine mutase